MAVGDVDDTLVADLLASVDLKDDVNYPDRILERLLSGVVNDSSKYSARYEPFINDDRRGLTEWLKKCLSTKVYDLFSSSSGIIRREQVSFLGGDVTSHASAIYLHLIQMGDGIWHWYIGQAHDLWNRIHHQHRDFRYRRDNPSLHYYAHDRSLHDRFVTLANLDDFPRTTSAAEVRIILNLLEMWCCLLFRCLPAQTLADWLHEEDFYDMSFDGPVLSLNVASPLDMGDQLASAKAFELLKQSSDELAQQYYADVRKGGVLRPKASPRKHKKVADAVITTSAQYRTDIALGICVGIFGTVGAFWIRRAFFGPASRIFRPSL